jgi:PAS domain S-box-containing protein
MSHAVRRRTLIIAVTLLFGMALAEGVHSLFFAQTNGWMTFVLTGIFGVLAAVLGVFLDAWVLRDSPRSQDNTSLSADDMPAAVSSKRTPPPLHLEADLLQLSRELEERANAHQNELARLNVELSLQMAMYQQAEDTARISEERFRNLADNIQEGLTIIENGRLVYVNDRACEIFGKCPEGDLPQRIHDFALPKETEPLNAILATELPSELQYWIHRGDGELRCIREHYSAVQSKEDNRIFVVTSDVTERVQALQILEQAVEDRTRELSTVLDISQRIASTLELEPLLNLILDQIASIIPYSGAAIYTLEEGRLQGKAYQMPGLPDTLNLTQPLSLSLANAGSFQPVITEKKVLILDDIKGDPPLARAFREAGISPKPSAFNHARSWIGIPLIVRDQVTGLLSLTHKQPGYYTQRHARLAQAITNQVAVAVENARLYEQAQDLATLEERNRIARELHDSVTQLLYGISLYSTAASRSVRKENFKQVEQNLVEIKDNSLQALREMRLLILELNPPLLQKHGLVAALKASLESIESRTGLETALKTDGVFRLPSTIEPDLYRIAMEALNNLVRYARAKKVTVDLQTRSNWIILDICDNGVGFDLEYARNGGGMGIHNMEQRAHRLGGRLEITSGPGAGTRIKAEIPLQGHGVEAVNITAGVEQ